MPTQGATKLCPAQPSTTNFDQIPMHRIKDINKNYVHIHSFFQHCSHDSIIFKKFKWFKSINFDVLRDSFMIESNSLFKYCTTKPEMVT